MDLLACTCCERRFYLPESAASRDRRCPRCGGDLALAEHQIGSIPIDARWLDPLPSPGATVVELRHKRRHVGRNGARIVRSLAAYFDVRANDRAVQVSVNRGEAVDAPLRVAAVLDGVDGSWEEHFYLPTSHSGASVPEHPPEPRRRRHLRLARGETKYGASERWA
jgi:ribosomal protein S27AE